LASISSDKADRALTGRRVSSEIAATTVDRNKASLTHPPPLPPQQTRTREGRAGRIGFGFRGVRGCFKGRARWVGFSPGVVPLSPPKAVPAIGVVSAKCSETTTSTCFAGLRMAVGVCTAC
jgi:hypothetical protein